MRIGYIMCYQQLLNRVYIAKATISDSVASSDLMMELPVGSDFISIVVRA